MVGQKRIIIAILFLFPIEYYILNLSSVNHLEIFNFFLRIKTEDQISIVYMTCKKPFNASKFNLPTFHISCANKSYDYCFEAVPYLKFIYDHYDDLEGKLIFIHGHEYSWHYRKSVFSTVKRRIKDKQFKSDSFGTIYPTLLHTYIPWKIKPIYKHLFYYIYHNTSMMKYFNINITRFYCCATFFVDASNFKLRPRYQYQLFIDRLINYSKSYPNPAPFCGRLMEYTWHLLLSNQPMIYYNEK